ncbi:CaiB/BaiF CoA transferase family protein [Brevibacterium album]|uniref:CaiB/BaiF CoA transferase family protein n=1 Tax=Brevibacterium album TaxID=417948 RepID=UPI0004262119|nr:CoA transferase [Brevibacterium album]
MPTEDGVSRQGTAAAGPLGGVRVVDFGHFIAAPGAGQTLADLGADVIKVETPTGDQARGVGSYGAAIIRGYNRRKRSVVLDLREHEQREAALDLVAGADVVIHNMRPGVMDRLGLGAAALRAVNGSVIIAAVTGFGTEGPSRARPGLDIAAQAESGLMSVTGEAGREPQRVGAPIVDHVSAGALVQGILAALFHRERTGAGDEITVSLLDTAVDLQRVNWGEYALTGEMPTRRGNGQPGAAPGADHFATSDGAVVVSAYTDEKFAALCRHAGVPELLEDPRFADNPSRVAHRPALLSALAPYFAARTSEAVVAELSALGIVSGAIRDYAQVLAAGDVRAGGVFLECRDSDGAEYRMPGLPFTTTHRVRDGDGGTVPALGQHTEEVLAEARARTGALPG